MNDKSKIMEVINEISWLIGFNTQVSKNNEEFISEVGKVNLKRVTLIRLALTDIINQS
jgi:hypothetical protein